MKSGRPCILVVSGFHRFVAELGPILSMQGFAVNAFESASSIADVGISPTVACVAIDADETLSPFTEAGALLKSYCCSAPMVGLCASPTIRQAVSLIRVGAADVVDVGKPAFEAAEQIRTAVSASRSASARGSLSRPLSTALPSLTRRENEVLEHVVGGLSSRQIGELLSLSHRTVGEHRLNIMRKFGVRNAPELIRKALG
jgi:FixJ family two-component response regulator